MKIKEILLAVAVAFGVTFSGPALANHQRQIVLTEGVPYIASGSFCASEGTVVSIIDEYRNSGMAKSVEVYEIYLKMGECGNIRPIKFTPIRLVAQHKAAGAAEVLLENGKTVYFIYTNLVFVKRGEEAPVLGEPA